MKVDQIQGMLRELAAQRGSGRTRGGEFLEKFIGSDRGQEFLQVLAERREQIQNRRASRRNARRPEEQAKTTDDKKTDADTPQLAPPTQAPDSIVPEEPKSNPTDADKDLKLQELARLYVQQFEEGSGRDLNEVEFEAKVQEVTSFYENIENGTERLDKVTFANDNETTA